MNSTRRVLSSRGIEYRFDISPLSKQTLQDMRIRIRDIATFCARDTSPLQEKDEANDIRIAMDSISAIELYAAEGEYQHSIFKYLRALRDIINEDPYFDYSKMPQNFHLKQTLLSILADEDMNSFKSRLDKLYELDDQPDVQLPSVATIPCLTL